MADEKTGENAGISTRDPVMQERVNRANAVLRGDLLPGHPLWKPWAMDLADDVLTLAAQLEVARERARSNDEWGLVP